MATQLVIRNLKAITTAASPVYDRSALSSGIVHIGVGNFHRAHQAVYLDALFNTGQDLDWAIVGAGVRPPDEKMRKVLAAQDFLTTVVEQSTGQSVARITGSMIDYLSPSDPQAIIRTLADPAIRIVSLTVTEGGYFIDAGTGNFDYAHPDIVADGAAPKSPKTVFGLIIAGLRQRRESGTIPFTVMSCDNIPHNGVVTRNAVVGLAKLADPEFAQWIQKSVAFPNGMVDRITPATGDRERKNVLCDFDIEDASPVFCEDFAQWVLEDNFPAGRPRLETVGVQFVPDVSPYESMKIRMLNGGHAIIAYPAGLLDIQFSHDAMAHPLIRGFLEKVEIDEIIPAVPPVPNTDLGDYLKLICERFSNPKVVDTIDRLCYDGSNRQPKFIIPTISDRLKAGVSISGLALESALWCRYCYGETESGKHIESNDPCWDMLVSASHAAKKEAKIWLGMEDIYGDVGTSDVFRDCFTDMLGALWSEGVECVLERYLAGEVS